MREKLTVARANALFVSHLSAYSTPTKVEVTVAIMTTLRHHGGCEGCAAEVAAEFGDHPDIAPRRMLWARRTVEGLYA